MRAADDTRPVPPAERLDAWLPDPMVCTRHRRDTEASPDALWAAANGVGLSDTRTLGRLVRWRIPGLHPSLTYGELFRDYPFTVLEEGERHLIAGLCGRIWTLARDYPDLEGAGDFRNWHKAGTVRVLVAHWTARREDGRAELVSEARVQPVDRAAALRLRILWRLVGPFERLVGAEGLTTAVRQAEGKRAREAAPPAQGQPGSRPRR
jgi:hypothetical protein